MNLPAAKYRIMLFLAGVYFFAGGVHGLLTGKWSPEFPPALRLAHWPYASTIGAAGAVTLGAIAIAAAILGPRAK